MKKYFIMLAIWFVVVVGAIVGSKIYKEKQGEPYAATAIPYLEQAVPILAGWQPGPIRNLMTPEALGRIPEEQMGNALEFFSNLGALEQADTPRFDELILKEDGDEQRLYLTYLVDTRFSEGKAQFRIQLAERDNGYLIENFTLSSDLLTPQ